MAITIMPQLQMAPPARVAIQRKEKQQNTEPEVREPNEFRGQEGGAYDGVDMSGMGGDFGGGDVGG